MPLPNSILPDQAIFSRDKEGNYSIRARFPRLGQDSLTVDIPLDDRAASLYRHLISDIADRLINQAQIVPPPPRPIPIHSSFLEEDSEFPTEH